MVEEESKPIEPQSEQDSNKELVETYEFFSNPVRVGMTLFNGMKLILSQLTKMEERLDRIEKIGNGNQK